jgi:hypothetical protein
MPRKADEPSSAPAADRRLAEQVGAGVAGDRGLGLANRAVGVDHGEVELVGHGSPP